MAAGTLVYELERLTLRADNRFGLRIGRAHAERG